MHTHAESSGRGPIHSRRIHLPHDSDKPSSASPQHHALLLPPPSTAGRSPGESFHQEALWSPELTPASGSPGWCVCSPCSLSGSRDHCNSM